MKIQECIEAIKLFSVMEFPTLDNRLKTFSALTLPYLDEILSCLEKTKEVTANQADTMEWFPIETAKKETACEFIGAIFRPSGEMTRDPFISFWSPTLGKFYCSPTHWMPLPKPPKDGEVK